MNSNTLRIRSSNAKKRIGTNFEPVVFTEPYKTFFSEYKEQFKKFIIEDSEKQVSILRKILFDIKENCDDNTVTFLVIVYLQADNKHPAKGIVSSFITKNEFIQQQFTEILTKEIENLINNPHMDYKSYVSVISKMSNCTENFPSGAAALKIIEIKLVEYFKDCLFCCINTLSKDVSLAPTEKTEVYSLSHLVLRLLLYVVQKLNEENIHELRSLFDEIKLTLKHILLDEDAPMDTKSVCGILCISMYIMENGNNSWMEVLESSVKHDLKNIMSTESAKLSIYSALVTVIPLEKLEVQLSNGEQAIMRLTNNILEIGETGISDAAITLGVSRALVPLSRWRGAPPALLAALCNALENGSDAVQHLAATAMRNVVRHCAAETAHGNEAPMKKLFSTLESLGRCRKSFYVSLTAFINELGAECVIEKLPNIIDELIRALMTQTVQASATTALEMLQQKLIPISDSEVVYEMWICKIKTFIEDYTSELDSAVFNILDSLLATALRVEGTVLLIVPDLMVSEDDPDVVVPLLLASAARRAGLLVGLAGKLTELAGLLVRLAGHLTELAGQFAGEGRWKDVLPYDMLRYAAVHSGEQERILCISLIVISPKLMEVFDKEELDLVLWFLRYNINAQDPHFRQILLSIMKKFLKRLEGSYKWLLRDEESSSRYYVTFFHQLRTLCFDSLVEGANYSRRHVALQLLAWMETVADSEPRSWPIVKHPSLLDHRVWEEAQVERLLFHLADSYELNKELALELLIRCPRELLKCKKYSTSLEIKDILAEASSIKPTECVTAAYKLTLLLNKLPEYIVPGMNPCVDTKYTACEAKPALFSMLMDELEKQIAICKKGIVFGARDAPMYGILHCIGSVDGIVDPFKDWKQNVVRMVTACEDVWSCTSEVLTSAAPEGHLPADERGNISLDDGKEVTAQMVLLCAWRSIKEVSLVLSARVTAALLHEHGEPPRLHAHGEPALLRRVGELFAALLTETKHRGAFEQVYVGFSKMLTRLWSSPHPEINRLPKLWLEELMAAIESGDRDSKLCSTRRSAGLPYMMQALVITELQATSSSSFDACMRTLLRLGSAPELRTRCHALNVLRALLRDRALAERGAPHVPAALLLALRGFERDTWLERNAATLLLGALMSRVFGVARTRDDERPCVRNRMTGRIFFLKYPQLYDYMLEKLKEVTNDGEEQVLRPSLYPILLILGRLYPSSLEGTVSNLKLSSFFPLVLGCARSCVRATRRLAARAAAALVEPERYTSSVEEILALLVDRNIKRNYCDGLLLQLVKILESKPTKFSLSDHARIQLRNLIRETFWILEQAAGDVPCYLIADEYIKMISVILWKFDDLVEEDFLRTISNNLYELVSNVSKFKINPGRESCLANAVYLIFITIYEWMTIRFDLICKWLLHRDYEVILAVLNCLLMIKRNFQPETSLQEHFFKICCERRLYDISRDENFIQCLCDILKRDTHPECVQKSLALLVDNGVDPERILTAKTGEEITSAAHVVDKLIYLVENGNENLTHLYLDCLVRCLRKDVYEDGVWRRRGDVSGAALVRAVRVLCRHARPAHGERVREAAASIAGTALFGDPVLEDNLRFPYCATKFAIVLSALQDESAHVRAAAAQSAAQRVARGRERGAVSDARASDLLLQLVAEHAGHADEHAAMLALLALLSRGAEVRAGDGDEGEGHVFDRNEKYNIYMEETVWARACARTLAQTQDRDDMCEYLCRVVTLPRYRETFEDLCDENLTMFENSIKGIETEISPKIKIFIDTLKKK